MHVVDQAPIDVRSSAPALGLTVGGAKSIHCRPTLVKTVLPTENCDRKRHYAAMGVLVLDATNSDLF